MAPPPDKMNVPPIIADPPHALPAPTATVAECRLARVEFAQTRRHANAVLAPQSDRMPRRINGIDAMADYLKRQERDRFLAEIARAAGAGSKSEAFDFADEALPLDNEALEQTERFAGVREPRAKYKAPRKKR
jgi:hypothetical protein